MSKMGLLQEIYCPEQIVIPQDFHLTVKHYAKAVIRTQPFDLLRWSAAYFRCMALNVQPPVKLRYEPIARHGALTKGIVRVLIDQLGKGYYVQKKILLEKWEGLCLPEEDLLNVLSLLRMLNWSQLHWLKIVAVFVGLLCNDLAGTAEMICEMLTEDPEGGPASVPLWMFRDCFVAVADLDCGTVQKFVNGRKVLDEATGTLEEEQLPPALPKVLSTISFKNAIIDKYRSMLEHETEQDPAPSHRVLFDDNGQLSHPSAVPSSLESDFKLRGGDTSRQEELRQARDFDSVIALLKKLRTDEARKAISMGSLSEAQLERLRERSRQIVELKVSLNEVEFGKLREQERQELLKALGPPWLLLYLFSQDCSRTKSFNYVEQTFTPISDGSASAYSMESIAEEELDAELRATVDQDRRKSSYCLPATVRARMSVSAHSAAAISNEVLSKVVCAVDQAIIDGECELSVGSISAFLEQKSSEEFLAPADHERLQSFLKEAESRELVVNDLNELYNFFVGESFKCGLPGAGRTHPADSSKEIFHIFGESGIDVDANLLGAKISDNMILGLVAPPPIEEPPSSASPDTVCNIVEPTVLPPEEEGEESKSAPDAASPSPPLEVPLVHEEAQTQTEPIEIACRQRKKPLAPPPEEHIAYRCKLSPIPGIGAPLGVPLRDAFIEYLSRRAAEQQGLIYPRNFREALCPKID